MVDCPGPENKKPATGREYGSSKTGDYAEGTRWLGLVPGKGIEPLAHCLQGNRSATELDRLNWRDSVDLNHDKQVNSLP